MGKDRTTDSFGTARWANQNDLEQEGILSFALSEFPMSEFSSYEHKHAYISRTPANRAFILGRCASPEKLLAPIRSSYQSSMEWMFRGFTPFESRDISYGYAGDGHIITIAPTRTGKGVGLVLPNLLNYPGSVIVTDPKGENYAVTAEYRRRVLKQEVICLDPFNIIGDSCDSINPLEGLVDYKKPSSEYLTQNPCLIDEVLSIADSMIIRPPEEKDPHWNDKARTMLKCIILAIICGLGQTKRRHLSEVRNILLAGNFVKFISELKNNKLPLNGMLAKAATEVDSMAASEFFSVVSSLSKQTEFLDSPLVQRSLGDMDNMRSASGTYDMRTLKTDGQVSIYMIVPPEHLSRYSRLLRIWITQAMNAMTRTLAYPKDGCPVLFMLDEIAQLGTLECMRQAVSLLAGYGMTIWMIWQDLSQLKLLYKEDWSSFLANAKIQQFFGINDLDSAKYVSEMMGKSTIPLITEAIAKGKSGKWTEFVSTSSSTATATYAEKERELLTPDEIRRLNRETMLMFVQGCPPILAKRISYYSDKILSARASRNPYYSTNK